MEIGRSKFYSQANASTIFNGLFHAYKGFFQVRSIDMCVCIHTYVMGIYIYMCVCTTASSTPTRASRQEGVASAFVID
jgi:hypothetical protein